MSEIYAAVDALPSKIKVVFQKSFLEGKDGTEIAAELKVSSLTVRNQKSRAIELLRQKVGKIARVVAAGTVFLHGLDRLISSYL